MTRTRHDRYRLAIASTAAALTGPAVAQWVEPDCRAIHDMVGENPGDQFGWVANPIGDVDGDGISEFIVTAATNGGNGANSGRIYLYDGATGLERWRATGGAGWNLGFDGDLAGDIDGDSVPDVIAGAPGAAGVGRAVVYSGTSGVIIRTFFGENPGDQFGYDASGGGDFNGDGTPDLLITAQSHDTAGNNAGRVYVYSADGTLICAIDGFVANGLFGSAGQFIGDVTHDGRDDIVVAARNDSGAGRAYVFSWDGVQCILEYQLTPPGGGVDFGWFFANGGHDVNADGTPDIYINDFSFNRAHIFSGVDGSIIWSLNGNGEGGQFGIGRIVEDVNGDGHADAILAAWVSGQGAPSAGKGFLYSGADASVLQTMTYTVQGAGFGFDAAGMMGDVDGDGAHDFLITAASEAGSTGRVFVMAGTVLPSVGDICPDSFERLRGLPMGGDLDSLCASDDDALGTRPDIFAPAPLDNPAVQVEMTGLAPTAGDVSILRFSVESSTNAGDSVIRQNILLWNFDAHAYDLLDQRLIGQGDATIEVEVSQNAGAYVDEATGEMRALVQHVGLLFSLPATWTASIDRAAWMIE